MKITIGVSKGYGIGKFLYFLTCVCVAMIGYTIHESIFWSVVDFIFTPIVVCYWLVTHQLTLEIIKQTFSFFFK